ncbi:MAG: sodium/proline symporter, partial [Myxococcota bacterium]
MSSQTAILLTLVLYKLALIGLGLWAQRRTVTGTDFFLGGRQLGPWVAALSASASSSSVWTLLGVSGAAYTWGLGAVWLLPACVGGFVLNWWVVAPRLQRESRRASALTVTEFLARGHRAVAVLASIIVLLSLCTYVASQFQGAGKAFHETFGWSVDHSILVGSAIVIIYTLLGGFWAVSLTDTLQGLLMGITAVCLPIAALAQVGFDGLFRDASPEFMSLTRNMGPAAAFGFIGGLLGIGIGYPGQPHVVNRFMALRDEAAVRTARVIAIVWAILVYSGMLILGWAGRSLLPSLSDNEVVFVAATHALFPPVVSGIMLASVLSAIMSTADSQLLVAASSVTHDLGLGRRQIVVSSRIVIVVLSLGAVLAALYGPKGIFDRVLFAWSAMGAAFGPLLLVTLWKGPVSATRTFAAMSVGFVLSVVAYSFAETKGLIERWVPFAIALAIAGWPTR